MPANTPRARAVAPVLLLLVAPLVSAVEAQQQPTQQAQPPLLPRSVLRRWLANSASATRATPPSPPPAGRLDRRRPVVAQAEDAPSAGTRLPGDAPAVAEAAARAPLPAATAALQISGAYELVLGEAPVAAAHLAQMPGTNKYFLMDYTWTPEGKVHHPPSNPEGLHVLQLWDRVNNAYTTLPVDVNVVCGAWSPLPDGNLGMYAGHQPAVAGAVKGGFDSIVRFDRVSGVFDYGSKLTQQRWYASSLNLPDGKVYIYGGDDYNGAAADFCDVPGTCPRQGPAQGADVYDPVSGQVVQVPMNAALQAASRARWYSALKLLPTGAVAAFVNRVMQVVDPATGVTLAAAPPLTGKAADLEVEYPYMGAPVYLRTAPLLEGVASRHEFVAFGGNWPARNVTYTSPCADVSVRIGINVAPNGTHWFDEAWEVEDMPLPRCIHDAILLPSGKVILINGVQQGIGALPADPYPPPANEPHNEPWEYDPAALPGQRFRLTGAKTRIARLYHGTSLLTSEGDILVTGTTLANSFQSTIRDQFDITPYNDSEYRVEVYRPPDYFLGPKPVVDWAPLMVDYGSTFQVVLSTAGSGAGAVTAVLLVDPGTVTHGVAFNQRSQELPFTARGARLLAVTAPPGPVFAPAGFYLLFLLAGNTYSLGRWVQLRPAPPVPPFTLPRDAALLEAASWSFDVAPGRGAQPPYSLIVASGAATATAELGEPSFESRARGAGGCRVTLDASTGTAGDVRLVGPEVVLEEGATVWVQLWGRAFPDARGASFEWRPAGGVAAGAAAAGGASPLAPHGLPLTGDFQLFALGPQTVPAGAGGVYRPTVALGAAPSGARVALDEIEVYVRPPAATVQALGRDEGASPALPTPEYMTFALPDAPVDAPVVPAAPVPPFLAGVRFVA